MTKFDVPEPFRWLTRRRKVMFKTTARSLGLWSPGTDDPVTFFGVVKKEPKLYTVRGIHFWGCEIHQFADYCQIFPEIKPHVVDCNNIFPIRKKKNRSI